MNDLETRLRNHGTAWRGAQPAPSDLDLDQLAAPRPIFRRPAVLAALAVAAAVLTAVLVAPTHHDVKRVHAGPGEVVVPWKDDPVPFPAPQPPPKVSALPACRVDALRASEPSTSSSTNWVLPVTNVGPTACALSAGPQMLTGDTPDGVRHQWHTQLIPFDAVDLAPGGSGLLALGTCAGPESVPVDSVTATMPDGELPLPGVGLRVCSGDAGAGAPLFSAVFVDASPKLSPLAALTARVEGLDLRGLQPGAPVPEPGRTVDYFIVLGNPSAKDVRLDPCPTYAEGIGVVVHAYRLNCDSVNLIPAHGEVRYRMRLSLTSADYYMAFLWKLQPDGPSING